ncbi:MAG: DNA mismatch repair endonuclease MutL [Abditibacteriales bacterium]|nr:DNA mismatch repair endonuclease MutL [Abditibacteriales bacterium]MDW8367248.1 DNA mismatch repair endonuclease MutL [Abditibacteriales bacterium]
MPNRILILPEDVASKIAAGEVIERPASVVKELVENALDAGARRVEVEAVEGGKKLIRVRDDGCGMSQQDAVLAFQRHATSKIQSAEDLFRIRTLGFRGEALPSIAAIAQVEVVTREADADAGTRVVIEGGAVTDLKEVGCPPGTTVTVKNLFFNTPARLKFLKTDATEAGHISELLSRFALCHHDVAFSLVHNGQEILRSAATSDPFAAVVAIYGRETARHFLPIAYVSPSIKIRGFISKPQITRANRSHQNFFVNGRFVRSRALSRALSEGYHGSLHGHDRHPMAVVMIDLDPELVDVNVHPTKIEVRFTREWEIYSLLLKTVRETLESAQLTPHFSVPHLESAVLPSPPSSSSSPASASSFGVALRQAWQQKAVLTQPDQPPSLDAPPPPPLPTLEPKRMHLTPVGQIRNTYILAESDEGLFIVNQHRAHERVILEQALMGADGQPIQVQRLVIPFAVTLSHREVEVVEASKEMLKGLGFDLDPFGQNSYIVRSVPLVLARCNYEEAFRDLVDELVSTATTQQLDERRKSALITMSCRSAIKAGDPLRPEEIQKLLDDLMQTESPFLCPHGQPIIISISHFELDKKFERI